MVAPILPRFCLVKDVVRQQRGDDVAGHVHDVPDSQVDGDAAYS